MKPKETFYDEVLAPVLADLAKQAEEAGLSFIAVVEWAPEETGLTATIQKGAGWGVRLAYAAAQCGNNIDLLIMNILRAARGKNRSSIYLEKLGEPIQRELKPTREPGS